MKVIIYSLENYINKEVKYDFNYLDKLNDNKNSMLYENDDLEKIEWLTILQLKNIIFLRKNEDTDFICFIPNSYINQLVDVLKNDSIEFELLN